MIIRRYSAASAAPAAMGSHSQPTANHSISHSGFQSTPKTTPPSPVTSPITVSVQPKRYEPDQLTTLKTMSAQIASQAAATQQAAGVVSADSTSDIADIGLSNFTQAEFDKDIRSVLTPDAQGNVHEEELQHGIVTSILKHLDPKAAEAYQTAVENYIGNGNPPRSAEDAVKLALQDVVDQGLITQAQAEKINGLSFKAAQLDDNKEALFDGKGGAGDNTIAVMNLAEAISMAGAEIAKILGGEDAFEPRALTAPSNMKAPSPAAGAAANGAAAAQGSAGGAGGISDAFLWKPQSEKDGKLIVLMPHKYLGQIQSVALHSSLPPSAGNMIEQGKLTSPATGGHMGREHYRFNKSGGGYPNGLYVVATLQSGQQITIQVNNTASRLEKK